MNDRYIDGGASLIQLYGWLRETGEIDRLIDLVIEKVRDSRQTEKAKDSEPPLRAENERLREAIKEWAPALRKACVRVLPKEAQPWMWLALLGEARDAADALDAALAAPEEKSNV